MAGDWWRCASLALFIGAAAPVSAADDGAREATGVYLEAISPRRVLAILDAEEGEVTLDAVLGGDATIAGKVDGRAFSIYFYDCDGAGFDAPATAESGCLGFEYRAYVAEHQFDADLVNQWNDENHYGTLWLDHEGDLALQLNVLIEGGAREDMVRASYRWWRRVMESLDRFRGGG